MERYLKVMGSCLLLVFLLLLLPPFVLKIPLALVLLFGGMIFVSLKNDAETQTVRVHRSDRWK